MFDEYFNVFEQLNLSKFVCATRLLTVIHCVRQDSNERAWIHFVVYKRLVMVVKDRNIWCENIFIN
jgi:hypothetical protein